MENYRYLTLLLPVILLTVFISGCAENQNSTTSTTIPVTTTLSETVQIDVSVRADLGQFLVDGKGMTLYLFRNDETGKSNCNGQCAMLWPPLLAGGHNLAGEGVIGTIGVIERTDGTKQLTYAGMPLYYYPGDKNPGEANGQGINGVWFVVPPETVSTTQPTTPTTSAPATTITSSDPQLEEFTMTVKQFAYTPDTITVKQGDRVRITATSEDVQHGFAINEYKINATINPGQQTVIEFVADKKGTFTYYCSIFCGMGHRSMKGTLIVQ